jgi:hypothetical protein
MALTNAGFATARGQSPYALSNLGLGGEKGLETYAKSMADEAADKRALVQQGVESAKSKLARQTGLTGQMTTSLGQLYGREAALEQAAASDRRTMSDKDQRLLLQMDKAYLDKVQGEKAILAKTQKYSQLTDAQLEEMAKKNINDRLTPRQREMLFGGQETKIKDATATLTPTKSSVKSPLVLPKSASEAVVGEIYNTKRGPAQWDGKQFIMVQ